MNAVINSLLISHIFMQTQDKTIKTLMYMVLELKGLNQETQCFP